MTSEPFAENSAALDGGIRPLGGESPKLDQLTDCIHCGLCLSYCPTYSELGNEMDSPRGRIYLMRAAEEGRIDYSPTVRKHIDLCLGCLACETACPSGVRYHSLIEAARTKVEAARERDGESGWVRRLALRGLLPHPRRLEAAAALLAAYRKSGLQRLVRASGLLNLMGRMGELEALSPPVTPVSIRRRVEQGAPGGDAGRASAALLTGCIMRVSFGHINLATVRVLAENGHTVRVPQGQVCCGALHGHSGDRRTARELARKNIDVFLDSGADFIVTNSAGCGSMMKEYGELLEEDPVYREKAEALAARVRDISEFLVEQGFRPPAKPDGLRDGEPLAVTYHEACHLVHGQKVRKPPREILRSLPGVEVRDLAESDWCCGSAGVYNLNQPEMAGRLLKRKVGHILDTGASVVATANPGCIIQIESGLKGKAEGGGGECGSFIRWSFWPRRIRPKPMAPISEREARDETLPAVLLQHLDRRLAGGHGFLPGDHAGALQPHARRGGPGGGSRPAGLFRDRSGLRPHRPGVGHPPGAFLPRRAFSGEAVGPIFPCRGDGGPQHLRGLGGPAESQRDADRDSQNPGQDGRGVPRTVCGIDPAPRKVPAAPPPVHPNLRRGVLSPGGLYLMCDHFAGDEGMTNDQLYMTQEEQQTALTSGGFATPQLLKTTDKLALYRAVQ